MLTFRELNEFDEIRIFGWIQNPELRRMIGTRGEPNLDTHKNWFVHKLSDRNNIIRIIEENELPIGIVGTNSLDLINRNAEMYLYIGETDAQGNGNGTNTVRNFVDFLFEDYKLKKVVARIFEHNTPSIKLFEKCGFICEGIQKDQILVNVEDQQYCNLLWYAFFNEKG